MLDQLRATSPKGQVLNVLLFVFNFLAWVATCVAFGSPLFTAKSGGSSSEVYWNKVKGGGATIEFSDCEGDLCNSCKGGGRGFIAFQVFAFLGLLAVLFIQVVRIFGFSVAFLQPTRKSLFLELALGGWNTFCFFLSVCIFGGACFHKYHSAGASVVGTGFGFTIACFFFLIINLILVYMIRGDSSIHLGSENGGSDYTSHNDANTTSYNPPASYQYNADPAAASYAGAYSGDIMPAQQDNNL